MTPRVPEPLPELHVRGLRLRAPTLEDDAGLLVLYRDPAVVRYLGMAPFVHVEQMRDKLARDLEGVRRGEAVRWVLVEEAAPGCAGDNVVARVVGYAALFHWSQADRRAEVGYVLAPHLWGQGLMRELLPVLLRFGFTELGLHRIEARVDPRNAASLRVLERCGFRREGLLRDTHAQAGGGFSDTAVLGLLEGEAAPGLAGRREGL